MPRVSGAVNVFDLLAAEGIAPDRQSGDARALWDAGWSEHEIARHYAMLPAEVAALPEMQAAELTAVHDSRAERAVYGQAVGGTGKAAQAYLAARKPQQWGQGVGQAVAVVVVTYDRDGQRTVARPSIEHDANG